MSCKVVLALLALILLGSLIPGEIMYDNLNVDKCLFAALTLRNTLTWASNTTPEQASTAWTSMCTCLAQAAV